MSPLTEADIRDGKDMARLMAGQETALNDLMERHATPVFHFLCRLTGNAEDANDLAQETFVRVFKSRGSFQPGQKFSAWLFTIAANLARNHFRWRARHPNIFLESTAVATNENQSTLGNTLPANTPDPGEHVLMSERGAAVRRAVAELPEDLREAIVLCEWEERSINEAAAIAGSTPKAMESRLYRARQQLRRALAVYLGD